MFGFSTGRAAFPNIYAVQARKVSLNDQVAPPLPTEQATLSEESLGPAIDGPPSPERIRAYTEQMKRSSIFGNNSRTNTLSSATSSSRSHDSISASAENLSLSRRSSGRSNASSMPSNRSERREGVQIFGSIFSRGSRRGRRNTGTLTTSTSSLSLKEWNDDTPGNDHYQGRTSVSRRSPPLSLDSRKKHLISHPYNFQHVTHTRQEQLPNLRKASGTELVSEFSAIRASQAPTKGEIKGIKVHELREANGQDMHFENFSSEAVNAAPVEGPSTQIDSVQRRRQSVPRKPLSPQQPQQRMTYARSYDNLQNARSPPSRPPRSPLSPTCPMPLPARTSSRTASMLFDNVDLLPSTNIDRPYTAVGFRRPAPFGIPASPQPAWSAREDYFSEQPASHAVTTPGDQAWPLTASTGGNFGVELGGIQEEDEDYSAHRRSRVSTASGDLRLSRSVPALRRRASDHASERPETRMSTTLGRSPSNGTSTPFRTPLTPGFQFHESWEDDIDFMYEHEAEADCDYQWDRISMYDGTPGFTDHPTPTQPDLDLHLGNDDHAVYRGRHRPSLVVPPAYALPELSPISNTSTNASPDLRTPSNFLRPQHIRSPSHSSSFKESHGFTLSPTLLIPSDFQTQVERDTLYDEHYRNNPASGTIFQQEPYNHPVSPVEETTSSTASFRSSNLSGRSARSSTSTRVSGIPSHDSVIMPRTEGMSRAHQSIGSAVSLPDLIPSRPAKSGSVDDGALFNSVAALKLAQETEGSAPEVVHFSRKHRYSKSLVEDKSLRKGTNHFPPTTPPLPNTRVIDVDNLSPVTEKPSFDLDWESTSPTHGRKISAPVTPSAREFKGRARAATSAAAGSGFAGKKRSSYMLFPQT